MISKIQQTIPSLIGMPECTEYLEFVIATNLAGPRFDPDHKIHIPTLS
jgi:hypothetical protein